MLTYRKDVDGLRAIAVLAVLGFHISDKYVSGGFVGVDIFFVISGFLITRIIWQELNNSVFSFYNFYAKRIRRLFPALVSVLVTCAVIEFFLGLPGEAYTFGLGAISSVFYVSNHYFLSINNYFDDSLEHNPLLHTWSLSVEEQFYIFFPALLVLIFKAGKSKSHLWLFFLFVCSLGFSALLVEINKPAAFFVTPSRLWEFLAGGLIALVPISKPLSRPFMEFLSWSGLGLIFFSIIWITDATPFPGIMAMMPVLGTALIIFSGQQPGLSVSAILANPVARFFGKISYSLYLWHWPLIVFYGLEINPEPSFQEKGMLILLSILLGYLGWRFIEQTTRGLNIEKNVGAVYWKGALATVLIAGVGLMFVVTDGRKYRFSQEELGYIAYLNYDTSEQFRSGSCFLTSNSNAISYFDEAQCIHVNPQKTNILIMGDSHAAQYSEAMAEALPDVSVSQITASGCLPLLDTDGVPRCLELMNMAFDKYIAAGLFDVVILAGRWGRVDVNQVVKTTNMITKSNSKVVFLGPIVEYNQSLPRLLLRFGKADGKIEAAEIYDQNRRIDNLLRSTFKDKNVQYYSILDIVCPGRNCKRFASDGDLMQFDTSHLTKSGANEVVADLLDMGLRREISIAGASGNSTRSD